MSKLRDLLIDGALLALPLGAAAYLLHKLVGLLAPLIAPAARLLPPGHWLGVFAIELAALVVIALSLILLGVFARSPPGRRLASTLEQLVLSKIPGYLIIKSIAADLAGDDQEQESLRPALVSFDDNQVLGFVVEENQADGLCTVFLPGSPSAGSGGVVLVPLARVQVLAVQLGMARRAMKQRGLGLQALTRSGPAEAGPR
jgi:uncharacterized membrane protein